jgi:alkylhydroperoxidase family enzyme
MLGGEDLVWSALRDLENAPLDEKDKAMLRLVGKITRNLPDINSADIDRVREAGWDDEAIYYAITTCALFNFYNRWITSTGVAEMSEEAHRLQGKGLASRGYLRE